MPSLSGNKLVFGDATEQTTAALPLTNANILAVQATLTAGQVGSLGFLLYNVAANLPSNTVVAGSNLYWSGAAIQSAADGTVSGRIGTQPSGSWRSLGYARNSSSSRPTTLFIRVS